MTPGGSRVPLWIVSYQVPTRIPERVVAGDTLTWKDSLGDYPADAAGTGLAGTWTLTTEIVGASADLGTFTAAASGSDHLTTVAAATTAAWSAGDYSYQQFVTENDDGTRHLVGEGFITIVADLAQAATHDGRSHVKQTLDALQAVILGKASKDQLGYVIGNRSITRLSPEELITWESHYKALYAQELRDLRVNKGLGHHGKIRTRFS